jgi:hypothetical protein
MSRRSDVAEGALNDIAVALSESIGFYFMVSLISDDERKTDHQYAVRYEGDATNDAERDFMTLVDDVGGEGDFDYTRWTFTRSAKGDTTFSDGLNIFILTLTYVRERAAQIAEPIAGAPNVQVGRYECQKRGLFGMMFEYCVTKKLADGEYCCGGCRGEEDPLPDLPPTSYYLCENLHLLCKPCKDNWRVENGNKGCPACRNETEYAFVITPNASQDN